MDPSIDPPLWAGSFMTSFTSRAISWMSSAVVNVIPTDDARGA
jgi:hypothetical protein